MLFNEKYRPKEFEDLIGLKEEVKNLDLSNLPHLLFSGSPGTGKTSLAKIIIKKINSDSITLNASDERGIDIIRDKIKTFAMTQGRNNNYKIIFLDEADMLTTDSQTCLRNIMETYSNNCRFILTCNYENKIIEALKSRCVLLNFGKINMQDIINRLQFVCEQEKISFEKEALIKIVERNNNDIRKSINKIEELKSGVLLKNLKDETLVAIDVFNALKQKKFIEARKIYLDNKNDEEQFLKDFYNVVFNSNESKDIKKQSIHEIAECYKYMNQVAWKEILIENMFLRVMEKC